VKGTLALSWGKWGGFYLALNGRDAITRRLCLGWFAVTWIGIEIDDLMEAYADSGDSSVEGAGE
jgi:hypothetical protein